VVALLSNSGLPLLVTTLEGLAAAPMLAVGLLAVGLLAVGRSIVGLAGTTPPALGVL
jgi:hypothetical protein